MPEKPSQVQRLKRRADFLRAAKGERFHTRAFTLQATPLNTAALSKSDPVKGSANSTAQSPPSARFGITVTKRVGGAVQRNRMRRRFKEALRLASDLAASPGRDYVIIAKAEALSTDFKSLQAELLNAIRKIDRPARQKPKTGRTGGKPPQAGTRSELIVKT